MYANIGVMKIETPMRRKIMIPVTLCSRTPKYLGTSPGADVSDSIFSELT